MTNLLGLAERPSDNADPRRTQKRVATSPSGRTVLIDITGEDRRRILRQLPGRWYDVMVARERGETLEQIARWAKCPPPCRPSCRLKRIPQLDESGQEIAVEEVHEGEACLAFYMARIYAWFETALHNLADSRARLMV